jgi:adenosylmethionine-8-amino-7-oxononanoate aminotransferase
VITLSPPLIAGDEEFEFMARTLRTVLADADREYRARL